MHQGEIPWLFELRELLYIIGGNKLKGRVGGFKTDYSGQRDLYFYHFISICFCLIKAKKERDEYTQHGILQLWTCGLSTAVSEAQ